LKGPVPSFPSCENELFEPKWGNVRKLDDYGVPAKEEFWSNFPKRVAPEKVETPVNTKILRWMIEKNSSNLTTHQVRRGVKLLKDLEEGASAYQRHSLPPTTVSNTPSAIEYGQLITDKLYSWLIDGYICGPYDYPPFPGFRCNPIMAVVRGGKVRPVINMSAPSGYSFNDNLVWEEMEKVRMTTAKDFSYKIKECGKNALMSKFDLKDAYKILPAKKEDWRLQGIKWLGKYFFETQMIFGATPSVSNFDRLGSTIVELAVLDSNIPRKLVSRTLDDIPVVAPTGTSYTEDFTKSLKNICGRLNLKLAEICPKKEKAFECSTEGIVLGIGFDTRKMEWYLPKEKADKFIAGALNLIYGKCCSLKQLQTVMGYINCLAQMNRFLKPYQFGGNRMLAEFGGDESIILSLQEKVKEDILVCTRFANSAREGIPIASRPSQIPLLYKEFYSDAAGAAFSMVNGARISKCVEGDRGVACLALSEKKELFWWNKVIWPMRFLEMEKDKKGFFYGSKTATLEAIGLLMPLLELGEKLMNSTLVFRTDNLPVVYGWLNGGIKFDETASIIIRAMYLISAYLGATVHVLHVPRNSDNWAELADSLSRKQTTRREDEKWLAPMKGDKINEELKKWLEKPCEDWGLPERLLSSIR